MPTRPARRRGLDPEIERRLEELLDLLGAERDRDQLLELLASAARLASDGADRLDLKIASAALREMRTAFRAFARYRDVPKVTMFGSARTHVDDPLYDVARRVAAEVASRGWMVVTGAGPGIMAAGMEGAGRERSMGVSIRLPFESRANPVIAGDDKLVSMKYFFTRKLMLVKESKGFLCLPGGFGTLDEAFELLTLVQTGKTAPAPIVMLDLPGGTYWTHWRRFLAEELGGKGLISPGDLELFLVTDDVERAVDELVGFYANYESLRFVGETLVVRLQRAPDEAALAMLNERCGHLAVDGRITVTEPLPAEVADGDALDRPRIALRFDRFKTASLRTLIDAVNTF